MDISNLTYNELKNLENEITKRKIELERTQYENLVNDVLNAIKTLIEAGYGCVVACYDDDAVSFSWENMLFEIQQEYKRKREDY